MKLYLINVYEAYRADEQGVRAFVEIPKDTIHYKHEVINEADVELPEGYEICATEGNGSEIFNGDEAVELITKRRGDCFITSLVSSDGIVELHRWL